MLINTPGYYGPGVEENPVLEKLLAAACSYPHDDDSFINGRLERYLCRDALPIPLCLTLIEFINRSKLVPVGTTGLPDNESIGSYRTTVYSEQLARNIDALVYWGVRERLFAKHSHDSKIYCSPVFRMMRYGAGGGHGIHHDAPYIESTTKRTHYSWVLYLNDVEEGGRTFFVNKTWDGYDDRLSHSLELVERDGQLMTSDGLYQVTDALVPTMGSMAVFEHRLPHGVEKFNGPGYRYVIRGDFFLEGEYDEAGNPIKK